MVDLRTMAVVLGLVGCTISSKRDTAAGTAVGNPGTVQLQTAKSTAIDLTSVDVGLATVTVIDDAGTSIVLGEDVSLDWTLGELEIPVGFYTGIEFNFNANPVLEGGRARDARTTFTMDLLQVRGIALYAAPGGGVEIVDGDVVVVEFGIDNFMNPVDEVLVEGEHIILDDERLRSGIEDTVRNESAAGQDRDGDGELDERTLRGR